MSDFDADRFAEQATAATGLDDFGEDCWRDGLERLLGELDAEADTQRPRPHDPRRRDRLQLANRLGIIAEARAHPEIVAATSRRRSSSSARAAPVRRSSTTSWRRIPQTRVPLTWEVAQPMPAAGNRDVHTDPRIAENEATSAMVDLVIPGFRAMHPLGPLLAQECVAITASELPQHDLPGAVPRPFVHALAAVRGRHGVRRTGGTASSCSTCSRAIRPTRGSSSRPATSGACRAARGVPGRAARPDAPRPAARSSRR